MKTLVGLLAFAAMAILLLAGAVDTAAGVSAVLMANVSAIEVKALEKAMHQVFSEMGSQLKDLRAQVLDLAQTRGSVVQMDGGGAANELAERISNSDALKAFSNGTSPSVKLEVPSRLLYRNAITNPAPGVSDPLRQPDRSRGIVVPAQQRLTIRGLFSQYPTDQGSVDVVQEATFTSNAAIQGNDVSPTGAGEGTLKAESQMTFTASTLNVPTIAHFIVCSRQVLSDVPRLQGHVSDRLLYGLALKEETEMLTATGSGLSMNGINNQATAFTGGVTNATALDTLARAMTQLILNNGDPNGIILHPTDWLAIKLLKDSQNRYILGDPAAMTMPMIWGIPVVPTPSQTLGKFTVLDARQAGYIADRETASVRISENVNDQFVRNLVTILAEERALIVVERPLMIIYGNLSHAG